MLIGKLDVYLGKDRREKADFIGASRVLEHLQKGKCPRKRIGLVVSGAPARGMSLFSLLAYYLTEAL
jgi:glycine cleavage system aminomethyltransferase T